MKFVTVGYVFMLCGMAGVLFGILYNNPIRINTPQVNNGVYGVILDSDHDRTTAWIYVWKEIKSQENGVASIPQAECRPHFKEIRGGIAPMAYNLSQVADYLDVILSWAHSIVPGSSMTPIYLKARNGVRQLPRDAQKALMLEIIKHLQTSGFYFENSFASILSPEEEEIFNVVAVNAVRGNITTMSTYGSLNIGRHSAGIGYIPEGISQADSMNIGSRLHDIYVHTDDNLGIEAVFKAVHIALYNQSLNGVVVNNPCMPFGHKVNVTLTKDGQHHPFWHIGTGNYNECRNLISSVLLKYQYTGLPMGNKTFIALGEYTELKRAYHLLTTTTVAELQAEVASRCNWKPNEHPHPHPHPQPEPQPEPYPEPEPNPEPQPQPYPNPTQNPPPHPHPQPKPHPYPSHPNPEPNPNPNPNPLPHHTPPFHPDPNPNHPDPEPNPHPNPPPHQPPQRPEYSRDYKPEHWESQERKHGEHKGGHRGHEGSHKCQKTHRSAMCFLGVYVISLIEDVYGIQSPQQNILWQNTVYSGQPLSWTYGYLLREISNKLPPFSPPFTDIAALIAASSTTTTVTDSAGVILLLVSLALLFTGFIVFLMDRRARYKEVEYGEDEERRTSL